MKKIKLIYVTIGILILVIAVYFYTGHQKSKEGHQWDQLLSSSQKEKENTQRDDQDNINNSSQDNHLVPAEQSTAEKPTTEFVVDVEGAVKHPGVYELNEGMRIVDAVAKAGGFIEGADKKKINLAKKVADEMLVYIPTKGEEVPDMSQSVEVNAGTTGNTEKTKININTADATSLEEIPGIGAVKAAAIIEYREKNGPFKTINDLLNISGIGEKSLEKIKGAITF